MAVRCSTWPQWFFHVLVSKNRETTENVAQKIFRQRTSKHILAQPSTIPSIISIIATHWLPTFWLVSGRLALSHAMLGKAMQHAN